MTDAHSWISGHAHPDHDPALDATYADVADMAVWLKQKAQAEGKDVWFLNNGDHTEGSGLSDASYYTTGVHGSDLFPLISMMPFDALTIGNHDLYLDGTVGFMQDSGFVDGWEGNYLTSNVKWADNQKEIGSRYTVLKGESGVSVMVFGFLYHMTDHCPSVDVEDPAETVKSDRYQTALSEAEDVDAIVVLSHMDLKDDNVYVISSAIRELLPEKPLQFVTGHTHYRGWSKVDSASSSFEAGKYLDTVGWISFDLSDSIYFNFQYVDANLSTIYNFTGVSEEDFRTPLGSSIEDAITKTVSELELGEVLGCPPMSYSYTAGLGTPDSLYDLYMNTIIPNAVLDAPTGTGNNAWHVSSTGTLRYDVYEGLFTYDDVFAVAPFANVFMYYPRISGEDLNAEFEKLQGVSMGGPKLTDSMPTYVGGPGAIDSTAVYDLFFNDYDQPYVQSAIASALGISKSEVADDVVPWRDDMEADDFVDTTTCWAKNVAEIWPCV